MPKFNYEDDPKYTDCPVCGLLPPARRGKCLAQGCRNGKGYKGQDCPNCTGWGRDPGKCPGCKSTGHSGYVLKKKR